METDQITEEEAQETITVNQFIKKLQALKPSLRELPVVIETPNGMLVEPHCKILLRESFAPKLEEKRMIVTGKYGFN